MNGPLLPRSYLRQLLDGAAFLLIAAVACAIVAFVLGNNYLVGSVVGAGIAFWGYSRSVDAGNEDLAIRHLATAWPVVTLCSFGVPILVIGLMLTKDAAFTTSLGWHWSSEEISAVLGFVSIAAVLSATLEELFFRGLLLRFLTSRIGLFGGVLAQALLFAFMHALGPVGIGNFRWLSLTIIGIVTALVYLHTRSLLGAIIVHSCWNFSSLLIAGLLTNESATSKPDLFGDSSLSLTIVAYSIVAWGLALGGLSIVYFRTRSLASTFRLREIFR